MKLSAYLLSILVLAIPLSCTSRKHQLADEWKISKVKIPRHWNGKHLAIDLVNLDKSRKDLEDFFSERYKEEGGFEPTSGQAEQLLSSYRRARLSFLDSLRFTMKSYGSMIPAVTPGWHFGDTVSGRWSKAGNMLMLTVGMDEMGPSFRYRIAEERDNVLRLFEIVSPEGEEGTEYILSRE